MHVGLTLVKLVQLQLSNSVQKATIKAIFASRPLSLSFLTESSKRQLGKLPVQLKNRKRKNKIKSHLCNSFKKPEIKISYKLGIWKTKKHVFYL